MLYYKKQIQKHPSSPYGARLCRLELALPMPVAYFGMLKNAN